MEIEVWNKKNNRAFLIDNSPNKLDQYLPQFVSKYVNLICLPTVLHVTCCVLECDCEYIHIYDRQYELLINCRAKTFDIGDFCLSFSVRPQRMR